MATRTHHPAPAGGVAHLRARVALLEAVCGEAYQLAGEVGAPVRVLDRFWAAAQGDPIPDEPEGLPVTAGECREVASTRATLAQVLDLVEPYMRTRIAARAGSVTSERKAVASRANGRKGGRPRKAAP